MKLRRTGILDFKESFWKVKLRTAEKDMVTLNLSFL